MRRPTAGEVVPLAVVVVLLIGSELVLRFGTTDVAFGVGHICKAVGGLGLVYALYSLAPWVAPRERG